PTRRSSDLWSCASLAPLRHGSSASWSSTLPSQNQYASHTTRISNSVIVGLSTTKLDVGIDFGRCRAYVGVWGAVLRLSWFRRASRRFGTPTGTTRSLRHRGNRPVCLSRWV